MGRGVWTLRLLCACVCIAAFSATAFMSCGSGAGSHASGSQDASLGSDASMEGGSSTEGGSHGDGGSRDAGPPEFQESTLPATSKLVVTLLDAQLTVALTSATVTANGAPLSFDSTAQAFVGTPATGRVHVTASAPGYIDWADDVPTFGDERDVVIRLRPSSNTTAVVSAADGGIVGDKNATIQFGAGSFPSDTSVGMTWTADGAYDYSSYLVDPAGGTWGIQGALQVQVAPEPSVPATVTLPLPYLSGLTAAQLALIPVADDGTVGTPIAPQSVTASQAVFSVPHFSGSMLGVTCTGFIFLSGNGSFTFPGAPQTPYRGMCVPNGATVSAGDQPIVLLDPWNHQLTIKAGKGVVLGAEPDGTPNATCGQGSACKLEGISNPKGKKPAPSKPRFMIRTRSAVMGVRGTAFDVSIDPCNGSSRTIDDAKVSEGDIVIDSPNGQQLADVTAPHEDVACDGCPNPKATNCCNGTGESDPDAGGVCCAGKACKAGEICLPCDPSGGVCAPAGTECCPDSPCGGGMPYPDSYCFRCAGMATCEHSSLGPATCCPYAVGSPDGFCPSGNTCMPRCNQAGLQCVPSGSQCCPARHNLCGPGEQCVDPATCYGVGLCMPSNATCCHESGPGTNGDVACSPPNTCMTCSGPRQTTTLCVPPGATCCGNSACTPSLCSTCSNGNAYCSDRYFCCDNDAGPCFNATNAGCWQCGGVTQCDVFCL